MRAVGERRRRVCGDVQAANAAAVDAALEGRAGLVGAEAERRRRSLVVGPAGPARIVVSGAVGVDGERAGGGRGVGVAGGVDRADLEGVLAVGERRRSVCGELAGGERAAVDAALERRARARRA